MTTQPQPRNSQSLKRQLYLRAVSDAFIKLNPRHMVRNPVMFVVEVGSLLTTLLWVQALIGHGEAPAGFIGAVALWLWFTVIFANYSEAVAEGRGKAQAEALRKTRRETKPRDCANPFTMLVMKLCLLLLCVRMTCSWWKRAILSRWMGR
jgi:K+-transporting ATPase ATPase B chain